jgi:hypothetical protein
MTHICHGVSIGVLAQHSSGGYFVVADSTVEREAVPRRLAAMLDVKRYRAMIGARAADDDDEEPGFTMGCDDDGDDDEELSVDEIRIAISAAAAASAAINGDCGESCVDYLDAPPSFDITDVYSSVLGDGFHMMDRPKVPIHHAAKKGYFVALRNSWCDCARLHVTVYMSRHANANARRIVRTCLNYGVN